jgi:hypothetical protein
MQQYTTQSTWTGWLSCTKNNERRHAGIMDGEAGEKKKEVGDDSCLIWICEPGRDVVSQGMNDLKWRGLMVETVIMG